MGLYKKNRKMELEELREIFVMLAARGLDPQLCDTPVPYYDTPIMCGDPTTAYENKPEEFLLPQNLVSMNPEFMVRAKGDSMCDAGIKEDDILKVMCGTVFQDGDIVLASIDGETTIKVYCEDEDGHPWLVPQNNQYRPIRLSEESNARIIGKVMQIIKEAPRVSYRDCMKRIREATREQTARKVITPEHVSWSIREIAPEVKVARQWYAVYRAMVDKEVLMVEDFETFCARIAQEVPEHGHLPAGDELQRLAVQSFRKPIKKWDPSDSPVTGKRYLSYQSIGLRMITLLEA